MLKKDQTSTNHLKYHVELHKLEKNYRIAACLIQLKILNTKQGQGNQCQTPGFKFEE